MLLPARGLIRLITDVYVAGFFPTRIANMANFSPATTLSHSTIEDILSAIEEMDRWALTY
jgi:hypothetical protein